MPLQPSEWQFKALKKLKLNLDFLPSQTFVYYGRGNRKSFWTFCLLKRLYIMEGVIEALSTGALQVDERLEQNWV